MINIVTEIAKKYGRKGDTGGSLESLMYDAIHIGDEFDLRLFLFNIQRCTKYSFEDMLAKLVSDDQYKDVLKVLLTEFNTINIDYSKLFKIAVEKEAYDSISLLGQLIPIQELHLSDNGFDCLNIAMDKSFVVFDKVLGMVITYMGHVNNVNNLILLELFMTTCIIRKDVDKLASICTGCLFLTKDESAVKLLINNASDMAFKYMDEDDIKEVSEDINSRSVLSKYLNS